MCRDTLRILRITCVLGLNKLADNYLAYLSLRENGFARCQLRVVRSHLEATAQK